MKCLSASPLNIPGIMKVRDFVFLLMIFYVCAGSDIGYGNLQRRMERSGSKRGSSPRSSGDHSSPPVPPPPSASWFPPSPPSSPMPHTSWFPPSPPPSPPRDSGRSGPSTAASLSIGNINPKQKSPASWQGLTPPVNAGPGAVHSKGNAGTDRTNSKRPGTVSPLAAQTLKKARKMSNNLASESEPLGQGSKGKETAKAQNSKTQGQLTSGEGLSKLLGLQSSLWQSSPEAQQSLATQSRSSSPKPLRKQGTFNDASRHPVIPGSSSQMPSIPGAALVHPPRSGGKTTSLQPIGPFDRRRLAENMLLSSQSALGPGPGHPPARNPRSQLGRLGSPGIISSPTRGSISRNQARDQRLPGLRPVHHADPGLDIPSIDSLIQDPTFTRPRSPSPKNRQPPAGRASALTRQNSWSPARASGLHQDHSGPKLRSQRERSSSLKIPGPSKLSSRLGSPSVSASTESLPSLESPPESLGFSIGRNPSSPREVSSSRRETFLSHHKNPSIASNNLGYASKNPALLTGAPSLLRMITTGAGPANGILHNPSSLGLQRNSQAVLPNIAASSSRVLDPNMLQMRKAQKLPSQPPEAPAQLSQPKPPSQVAASGRRPIFGPQYLRYKPAGTRGHSPPPVREDGWKDRQGKKVTTDMTASTKYTSTPQTAPNEIQVYQSGLSMLRSQAHYAFLGENFLTREDHIKKSIISSDKSVDASILTNGGRQHTRVFGQHVKAHAVVQDGSITIRGGGHDVELTQPGEAKFVSFSGSGTGTELNAQANGHVSLVVAASSKPFGPEPSWKGRWHQIDIDQSKRYPGE